MIEKITGKALEIVTFLMSADKEILWDLIVHKDVKKRSLSSNSYYWNLLEDLAIKTHIPKMKLHNLYLRQVGQTEKLGGKPMYTLLPDNDETEEETLLASTYHLAPRRETQVGTDGVTYRWYVMLKGSSDFSVEEMNMLVDLAVQDAKEQGIEVLTPDELAHIRELEKQHEERKNKGNVNSTKHS